MFCAAGLQQLLIPYLVQATGRSAAQCSWILGSVYFSAMCWRVVGSYTIARLGFYGSLVLGFVPYVAFPLVLLFSKDYTVALVAAIVWGWGAAAIWIAGPTNLLATSDASHYGRASGFFYACVHAGQMLGVYVLALVRNHFGWETWLWTAFGLYFVGECIILFLPRVRQQVSTPALGAVLAMYRDRRIVALACVLVVSSVGFGLTLSAMTGHVERSFPNGLAIVGYVTLGFYIGRLLCSLCGGWFCDRWGRTPVMVSGFAAAALGLIAASLIVHEVALFLASFTLGGVVGIAPVATSALIGDSIPAERRHLAFGSLHLWGNFGIGVVIVVSQYLGALFQNFRVCFAVFAVLYATCAVVVHRFSVAKPNAPA
jgi:MFS family permease